MPIIRVSEVYLDHISKEIIERHLYTIEELEEPFTHVILPDGIYIDDNIERRKQLLKQTFPDYSLITINAK